MTIQKAMDVANKAEREYEVKCYLFCNDFQSGNTWKVAILTRG